MWEKLRKIYPEDFCPQTTSTVEDIRANWTTHHNLNDWFTNNKQMLIDCGLFKDNKMKLPNGEISELTYPVFVARRILTMDETMHIFTTETDKGGSRSISYGFDKNSRKGKRGTIRGSHHTTGVYIINADGKTLPPLYIFDSSTQNDYNYQVQPSWCKTLSIVKGRYGLEEEVSIDSFVSVRSKGSIGDSLFRDYIRNVILPLYPNITNECEIVNGKFIKRPVIFKTDSGPGRLKEDMKHVNFLE